MALYLLAPVVALCAIFAYVRWTYGYWRRRGLPCDAPRLVFGSFLDAVLLRKTLGEVYRDIYRRMAPHPVCGYFKCLTPAVLVRDAEVARKVLLQDFSNFRDNDFHQHPGVDPMFGRSPFTLKGDRWKEVRSQLTPGFTSACLRDVAPRMSLASQELKTYIERQALNPDGVDAKLMSALYATDAVSLCMLGVQSNTLRDEQGEFARIGNFLLESSLAGTLKVLAILMVPRLAHLLRFRFIPEAVASFFRRVVREATAQRKQSGRDGRDYLQLSIALRARHADFTDEDASAHATMFYMDGFEPTSTTLCLALFELATHGAVQERLRAEVDDVLGQQELSHAALQDMHYMDMVVSETLRLYPPLRSLDRLCTKRYQIELPSGQQCTIEPGTPVIIPVYALQRDPQHYPQPDSFNPEHFTEENKKLRNKCTYMPFGDGPRACVGSRYAVAVVKMALATILRDYKVLPVLQTPVVITHDVYSAFYLAAKETIRLQFQKR